MSHNVVWLKNEIPPHGLTQESKPAATTRKWSTHRIKGKHWGIQTGAASFKTKILDGLYRDRSKVYEKAIIKASEQV